MPPRKSHCRVVTPPESEPASPNVAPALQPEASTSQDNVGPGDVPGNDKRAHGGSGPEIRVNNPDAVPPKRTKNFTPDILYFFDRTGVRAACKECR